ncbi:type I-F CRISPR-associated endoribonuclease Cas6/Csy4 [Aquisalimonas asiatica]|uniref:CRISPR-associated protein, Csy4 family n=1 Tax=Aquisalimonas asiatica TaxID=406100 RepID=A0A1H8T9S3_9GAMM|nr:type I-F CRISPR-associated endoribonuclease Cas6/Csy4 [Aquisalimonas asiatica]SEO87810.1 CRISPR-associated protein, Csy4 family [Aquisalimonas asiatica]
MDRYVDIQLRPDPDFSPPMLMGALFSKLHRALVALGADDIGVSFPSYTKSPRGLGDKLRLHGTIQALSQLMEKGWLSGMYDHVAVTGIESVPDQDVRYRLVRRRQPKTNAERLRRRRAKRHGESLEQARAHIPDSVERATDLPFVTVRSLSTGERFSLFIEHGELWNSPQPGAFNRYGLSQDATIPWF